MSVISMATPETSSECVGVSSRRNDINLFPNTSPNARLRNGKTYHSGKILSTLTVEEGGMPAMKMQK